MKKLTILLLLTVVLFSACKSEKQKEGIKKTEDMLVKVDAIKKQITAPEIEAYKKIYDTTKVYIAYFEHLPANFERNDSIMNIIYLYGTVDKCFKKYHSVHVAGILGELELSKSQIENLNHDISEGFFEDSEIDAYIHIEDSILNDIQITVKSRITFGKQQADLYKELQPQVITLKHEFEKKYK